MRIAPALLAALLLTAGPATAETFACNNDLFVTGDTVARRDDGGVFYIYNATLLPLRGAARQVTITFTPPAGTIPPTVTRATVTPGNSTTVSLATQRRTAVPFIRPAEVIRYVQVTCG